MLRPSRHSLARRLTSCPSLAGRLFPTACACRAPPRRIKGGRTPTTGFCTAPFFVVPPNEGGAVALSEAADVALAEELTAFTKEMRTQFKTPYLFELAKDDGASIECNNIRCGAKNRRGPCCKEVSIRRCLRCGAVGQSAGCGSCATCCAACCQLRAR